jgi:hypothetical protein
MQASFGIVVAIVLLAAVYSVPLPQQLEFDILQVEFQFVASLTPQQRGLWGKIKDKVTNAAINVGVSALAGAVLGKRDVSDDEVQQFVASLTPQQRGLWGKIKDKVTNAAISTAVGALIGKK